MVVHHCRRKILHLAVMLLVAGPSQAGCGDVQGWRHRPGYALLLPHLQPHRRNNAAGLALPLPCTADELGLSRQEICEMVDRNESELVTGVEDEFFDPDADWWVGARSCGNSERASHRAVPCGAVPCCDVMSVANLPFQGRSRHAAWIVCCVLCDFTSTFQPCLPGRSRGGAAGGGCKLAAAAAAMTTQATPWALC